MYGNSVIHENNPVGTKHDFWESFGAVTFQVWSKYPDCALKNWSDDAFVDA